MIFRISLFFLCLGLFGCNQAALTVQQQKVSATYLASANVGSPDPRTPPDGQMILAEWWLPKNILACCPMLRMDIVFCDCSQTCVEFPITSRIGYETYAVLNEKFKETGGFMSYRVQILTGDDEVYADWKHQLWVKLIDLGSETEEINSAMVEKSRQPSVTDTPSW